MGEMPSRRKSQSRKGPKDSDGKKGGQNQSEKTRNWGGGEVRPGEMNVQEEKRRTCSTEKV